jgi:hypothetical protein
MRTPPAIKATDPLESSQWLPGKIKKPGWIFKNERTKKKIIP